MKVVFKGIGKLFRAIWKLISFTRQLILNLFFFIRYRPAFLRF